MRIILPDSVGIEIRRKFCSDRRLKKHNSRLIVAIALGVKLVIINVLSIISYSRFNLISLPC